MFRTLVFAILLAVPSLAKADALGLLFDGPYTVPVVPIDANSFEAIEADGAGAKQMWCAAGIFANNVLGQGKAKLYIKQARGSSVTVAGRKGVIFTTQPVPDATKSYSFSLRKVGLTFSVSTVYGLCEGDPFRRVRVILPDGRYVWY